MVLSGKIINQFVDHINPYITEIHILTLDLKSYSDEYVGLKGLSVPKICLFLCVRLLHTIQVIYIHIYTVQICQNWAKLLLQVPPNKLSLNKIGKLREVIPSNVINDKSTSSLLTQCYPKFQ